MSSSLILLVCVVIIYFLFFFESRRAKMLRHIRTPQTFPLIGLAFGLNVSNETLFQYLQFGTRYGGGSIMAWLVHKPYVLIGRADWAQKMLSSSVHIDKSADYDKVMPWLGTGLLTSQGHKWCSRRKLLTSAFHFKILDCFVDVMNEQSGTLVQILREKFAIDGQSFDIFPYVTRCTLDIICETAMGRKINAQKEKDSDYVKAIYRISELIQHRQVRPWLHPNFLWRLSRSGQEEKELLTILHGFTESVIRERKAQFHSQQQFDDGSDFENDHFSKKKKEEEQDAVFMKGRRRVAFLDLLLTAQAERAKSKNPLTDVDIREETDTFMFEGHDTTASGVNWVIFLLGCHPEYQMKVHEELYSIFGNDRHRPVTSHDMTQMKYLECCIKEALRLYPPVPFIARSIKKNLELDNETTIPAGTTLMLTIYQLHRDPIVFPEPEAFYPDRFFPENCEGRSNFAYVPFSAGPRNCIGQKFAMMEEKVVLANIFRNFRVEAAERRSDIVLLAELIMRPKNGLRVKMTPRN